MSEIIPFPPRGGGDGPDDPTLERRVERLEAGLTRIETILVRLEPRIVELGAKTASQADLSKVQQDIAEMKGRFGGLEARLSALPTTPQLVLWLLTTWGAGAAIVFALLRFGPRPS